MDTPGIIICIFLLLILFLSILLIDAPPVNRGVMNWINGGEKVAYMKLVDKYPKCDEDRPVYIVYHIATIGDWKSIVTEQVQAIKDSGLYDECEGIWYGCNCQDCPSSLADFFRGEEKIHSLRQGLIPDKKTYENGTLNAALEFFSTKPPGDILYIHSKGVTARYQSQNTWRRYMMNSVAGQHRICRDLLNRGFNTVGVCHSNILTHYKHYSGNMWWSRSDYFLKHQPIKDLSNRYEAEWFILGKDQETKNVCLIQNSYLVPQIHSYDSSRSFDGEVVIF